MRDVHPQLTDEYLKERAAQGWRVAAIEWERDESAPPPTWTEEVPYGLKVANDCRGLEENTAETAVMLALMEQIVQDKRISEAAVELNRRGYRNRTGRPWTAGALFDMLPRLIDMGPRLFRTADWAVRRRALVKAVAPTILTP